MTGALVVNGTDATQATFARDNSGTSTLSSIVYIGNNIPDGTAGCSDGQIRIYGNGSNYTTIEAPNSTASRKLTAPDASGTLALTSDVNNKVSKSGDTITGNLQFGDDGVINIYRTSEPQANFSGKNTGTTSTPKNITIGNSTADGTTGSTYGRVRIMGKGSYRTDLQATSSTANRSIELPDASGTVALTSDLTCSHASIYGWASSNITRLVGYLTKIGNFITITGSWEGSATNQQNIFTVPSQYRPSYDLTSGGSGLIMFSSTNIVSAEYTLYSGGSFRQATNISAAIKGSFTISYHL